MIEIVKDIAGGIFIILGILMMMSEPFTLEVNGIGLLSFLLGALYIYIKR